MDLGWHEAIVRVLQNSGSAMHYVDIADSILSQGLKSTLGATPAKTVSSVITTNINTKGDKSEFVRTSRGEYVLRASATGTNPTTPVGIVPSNPVFVAEDNVEPTAIEALGMYWRRDLVEWNNSPKLIGQQQRGATEVDFAGQRGVYLLHDGRDTVYVGRVTDRPLGRRLFEHTTDRLNGRWDRFSWFGVCKVHDDGKLTERTDLHLGPQQILIEMEAVLIETLEPPLNRRRGDGLRAVEYIQVEDPLIKKKHLAGVIAELQARMLT
jgi:hypothetical protein